MLVLFCVLNEEVQEAWKLACLGKKEQSEEATRSTQVGKGRSSPGGWGQAACQRQLMGTSSLPCGERQEWVGGPCPGLLCHLLHRAHALSSPQQGPSAYNNTALFEESGLIRITLGASTISSVSSVRSARTHSSQRAYLR